MSANALGRSLQLYFVDGKPEGMQTAEVFNWTGHLLMTPRLQIAQALRRKEAQYTGVYLLLGDKDGVSFAYIGESENIGDRIRNHDQRKDWWTKVIFITTTANNLHRAHIKYLESRLIELARQIGRVSLENGNNPQRSSLSEADEANMESFLDYLQMVLPALRVDIFIDDSKPASLQSPDAERAQAPRFELDNRKRGLHATATLIDGEFIVDTGSSARLNWDGKGSADTSYGRLHQELRHTGVLREDGANCVFTKNYAFRSPSAAAAVVNGRPTNGTTAWKREGSGETYKAWEASILDARPNEPHS